MFDFVIIVLLNLGIYREVLLTVSVITH